MTTRTPHAPPDELRKVEDHHQTEHKLDVVRRLYGSYLNIVAGAKTLPNRREAWLVETHAGAGLHRSREDPDGRRYGSALIACQEARYVQKRFPQFRVHVRAIDIKREWVIRLSERVEEYRHAHRPEEVVDVRVIPGDFAQHLQNLLNEAQLVSALSLWFIDPYGFKDIPYAALRPMMMPRIGPEVLINLDLSGIWRKIGDPDELADVEEVLYHQPSQQTALTALYGGHHWRAALKKGLTYAKSLETLAETYKERFASFEYRSARRLRSSENQIRFLIHLAHREKGWENFNRCFEESLKSPLLTGRALDPSRRGHAAHQLFKAFRGRITTIDDLYETSVLSVDRGQLRVVLREAEERGFGKFDENARTMYWAEERWKPEQTVLPLG